MVHRVNKSGDLSREWLEFRKLWLLQNPPLDNGCYLCGICGRWVKAEEVTLDHIKPRRPDNIFDPENIQPAHWICNSRKGSNRWDPVVGKREYDFLRFLSEL